MYEKRLTFSWNRQPSHLKGEPACLSVFQVSERLPGGGERLILDRQGPHMGNACGKTFFFVGEREKNDCR